MAPPSELRTLLTADTLLLLSFTSQTKKVQMQKAKDSNFVINDIVVATTPIQTVKTLKIYEPDFYYGNQNKLQG